MFNLVKQIIDYTQTSQYSSTIDGYMVWACCAIMVILTIVFCDWLRLLFRALIHKLR